jgi:hypothetical protein
MCQIVQGPVVQWPAVFWGALLLVAGCTSNGSESGGSLFERVPASASNIAFSNDLSFNNVFNIYTYKDFYAGGGVALGDVNGDGLLDVYLVANQQSNKLYLNRGNFTFEDVTEQAGVGGAKAWSTGASMADVNGDGRLDIYVTNAGVPQRKARENELFINNGDLSFTERAAAFGLADDGFSVHAAFFDYDNDGDLDAYLLNNYASKPIGRYDRASLRRDTPSPEGGDRLYRNDTESGASADEGTFTDVTEQAGIYSSEAGFGLGVSVGDINRDGWMDLYVSNDFFERDYFYLNRGDGTFREVLEEKLNSTSTTSMGGDIADLDNDGFPELFVSDMLPESEARLKTVTDFIGWEQYRSEVAMGYHRKFTRNTLQYNNADGTFSEIGRYAGVEATGWSWGALIADFNLDGMREIFVPNGMYKDVTDKDHLVNVTQNVDIRTANNQIDYQKLVELTPSVALPNYMFENRGALRFTNRSAAWGLDEPSYSNGAAYGDLDGDGDLDLVVNNVNMEAFIYRNRALEQEQRREEAPSAPAPTGWLQLQLDGEAPNTYGVGAHVEVVAGDRRWVAEQMPQRGFQSSVDPTLHIGLGAGVATIDTLWVRWPDGRVSRATDLETRQQVAIRQAEARPASETGIDHALPKKMGDPLLTEVTDEVGLNWTHEETPHNDFEQSPLLLHMRSTEGPPLCTGDVNGDERDDVFVGGARDQAGALFLQGDNGRFAPTDQPVLEADRAAEDTACEFVNVDGDGRPELYVGSGSSEFPAGSEALVDRLYRLQDGGTLVPMEDALPARPDGPTPTGVVRAADVDGDGDQDVFVGVRMTLTHPGGSSGYGTPVGGYLLANDGAGRFEDVTAQRAPQVRASELQAAGITDAAWGDLNGDGSPDLMVTGEWMPLTVFFNQGGRLERADLRAVGVDNTRGWWQHLTLADLDADGDLDLVGGNHGLNSRFEAHPEQPVQMWAGDFDRNGRLEHIMATYSGGGGPYPVALRQHLVQQLPDVGMRYPTFSDYAETTVSQLFDAEQLEAAHRYRAEQFASVVGWNDGRGQFRIDSLSFRAQLAPLYAVLAEDVSGDDVTDLLVGGNLDAVQPQAGPYMASYGTVLVQDSTGGYQAAPSWKSGFASPGEIRAIRAVRAGDQRLIVVARSDDRLQAFRITAR